MFLFVPSLVLMKRLNVLFFGGWKTEEALKGHLVGMFRQPEQRILSFCSLAANACFFDHAFLWFVSPMQACPIHVNYLRR